MHEAQGERMQPGPPAGGRRVPRPPARLPRRGASPLAAVAQVRGVPSSCALQAAGTFHPTGCCYSCACFASLSERRALGCGQRLQLQPAPVLPPPGDRLFTISFFLSVPGAAACPITTAGRWAASLGRCLYPAPRGGWQARQQPKAAAHLHQQDG